MDLRFTRLRREWKIQRTLRALARQHVVTILKPPDNRLHIEGAPKQDDETEAALRTCYMRGWVEPIEIGAPERQGFKPGTWEFRIKQPTGRDGQAIPKEHLISGTTYRLTEGGWSAIHRTHELGLLSLLLTLLGIIAAFI